LAQCQNHQRWHEKNSGHCAPTYGQQYEIKRLTVLELNLVFAGSNANRSEDKITSENFNWATIHRGVPSGGPSISNDQPAIFRAYDF